ncbi:CDP-alcohol phosphatidyltransferase family protein [Pseudofrancisella aestuarii]|uniref:Phosphatidylcholine synthase n=1 Tax=Pseudofrancisella aestuarii TaxID=2670347 RepID=A0ABV9TEC8_9GAMM|nr:CDP-alcohol phosphatidyltransferase family protein [Pseudofrancisella aestuarii]
MILKKVYAWSIHLFTALGAVLGVLAIIYSIQAAQAATLSDFTSYYYYLKLSLYCVIIAIIIDAVDGTLARTVDIKKLAPFDGALLDNIIDFTTYSIVPCIWIYVSGVVSESWLIPSIVLITISSSYQFCQPNAKTNDNFFVGFPSYWNIIVMLMLCFQTNQTANQTIILVLSIFSFIPIKYIYLSRLDNISKSKIVKFITLSYSIIASSITVVAIYLFPQKAPDEFLVIIITFIIFYIIFSFKLNIKPIK